MDAKAKPPNPDPESRAAIPAPAPAPAMQSPNLEDPAVVLSLLEADQVVAVKQRTRFGKRRLSPGLRVLLWALRVYVVLMLITVAISVIQTMHSLP